MSGRRPVMRLFVAAYPPAESARSMLALLDELDLPDHRAVPPEQVHMTLQFIGDTDARRLDEVARSVERAAAGIGPFDLAPRELVCLPERGDPRLVALTTDAPPGLLEMQRRLAARLARNPRERQRFLPHFTLCRFRAEAKVWRVGREAPLPAFPVRTILLMQSVLRPDGAQHREVARVELAG